MIIEQYNIYVGQKPPRAYVFLLFEYADYK